MIFLFILETYSICACTRDLFFLPLGGIFLKLREETISWTIQNIMLTKHAKPYHHNRWILTYKRGEFGQRSIIIGIKKCKKFTPTTL